MKKGNRQQPKRSQIICHKEKIELKKNTKYTKQRVEYIIFIPYTPHTTVKRELQEWKDMFSKTD